jgi:hydrogenase small subunit
MYGRTVRALRSFTRMSLNREPDWRAPGTELSTGYEPTSYGIEGEK